jgi:hypothetical protein
MAYMRGDIYLWHDESGLHLWNADGNDGWDDSLWACSEEDGSRHPGYENASGVSIPQETMDEYVVMRLAELLEAGILEQTVDRAVMNWGRASLERNAEALKAALRHAKLSTANQDQAP